MTRVDSLVSDSDFVERLLATTHAIVILMDPEGRIVMFNQYLERLSGHTLDEVRGQDWFSIFIPEEERDRLRELYRAAIGDIEVRANLNPIVTKSGELRQIEWWGNTVHAEDGRVLGLVSVGEDVTELLAERQRMAETERLASIGMMASVFAHEVGNPLNAIFLQAQLLRRRIDRPDRGPLGPKLDSILAEIRRLNMLLEDFRAYRNPRELHLELTDLGAVLREVVEVLDVRARERDVRIRLELEDELPQISGNANKLKQVFVNLCKNGFEAMPEGGELLVRAAVRDEGVDVEVHDQGRGIDEGLDVFEPFSTTKPSGMGLGLPLVREIVQAHGGEVRYSSRDPGTTFVVRLPKLVRGSKTEPTPLENQ